MYCRFQPPHFRIRGLLILVSFSAVAIGAAREIFVLRARAAEIAILENGLRIQMILNIQLSRPSIPEYDEVERYCRQAYAEDVSRHPDPEGMFRRFREEYAAGKWEPDD